MTYYLKKAELIDTSYRDAYEDLKKISTSVESTREFVQLRAKLKETAEALKAAGVNEAMLKNPATVPTAAQAKAFRNYIDSTNKALQVLETASINMEIMLDKNSFAPLSKKIAELKQETGQAAADEYLEQALLKEANYRGPWGLDPAYVQFERRNGKY